MKQRKRVQVEVDKDFYYCDRCKKEMGEYESSEGVDITFHDIWNPSPCASMDETVTCCMDCKTEIAKQFDTRNINRILKKLET